MTDARSPRWEWRTFSPSLDVLDALMPGDFEIAHDIYLLGSASNANVKIRSGSIDVKTLDDVQRGLELWRPSFSARFPLCHRDVRSVLRYLGVAYPETLFLPCYSAPDFLTDIACCLDGVHVIGVNKARRHATIDACIVERASVSVAGHVVQTAAIESTDAAAVMRQIDRLRFDRTDHINYVDFLKRLLGVLPPSRAHAPSEGARHEDDCLPLVPADPHLAGRPGVGANIRTGA